MWIVFTIIDAATINIGNLNVDLPTGVGLLGIITIILSIILPIFVHKSDKKDDEKIE